MRKMSFQMRILASFQAKSHKHTQNEMPILAKFWARGHKCST